ncbi:unnamed protein product [Amoebophrya sp. A25]|nr:unnamed protein product [Amoebophrya sp. A25]|eukprot:GSA25T00010060001.1
MELVDSGIREGSAQIFSVSASSASTSSSGPASTKNNGTTTNNDSSKQDAGRQEVFYNPAQVYNRDLSVVVLSAFSVMRRAEEETREKQRIKQKKNPLPENYQGMAILEALAASGLRSVRYWKEVPDVKSIVVNDFDATAVEHMKKNLQRNGVISTPPNASVDKVRPNHGDAILHCYTEGYRMYDVIDLDPYGTASPFLDGAIRGIKNGGLLCVTSTDMPILGGNHPETCFYRYGGTPLKAPYVHEMSLRLLLNALASTAARHQRVIEPLLSASMDFYIRVFVRIRDSPLQTKDLAKNTGVVLQCVHCETHHMQPMGEQEIPAKAGGEQASKMTQGQASTTTNSGGGDSKNQEVGNVARHETEEASAKPEETASELSALDPRLQSLLDSARTERVNAQAIKGLKYRSAKMNTQVGGSCDECGSRFAIGGPCWLGPLHNKEFLNACIALCEMNEKYTVEEKEQLKAAMGMKGGKNHCHAPSTTISESEKNPTAAAGQQEEEPSPKRAKVVTSTVAERTATSRAATANTAATCSAGSDAANIRNALTLPYITQWRKILGMVTAMSEELGDVPLHYSLPALCRNLRVDCVPMRQFRGALAKLCYRASHFHRDANAIKTDAPPRVVFDLVRHWAKQRGGGGPSAEDEAEDSTTAKSNKKLSKKQRKLQKMNNGVASSGSNNQDDKALEASNSAGATSYEDKVKRMASREIVTEGVSDIVFEDMVDAEVATSSKKVAKFLPNPTANWGPKPRAKPVVAASSEGGDE